MFSLVKGSGERYLSLTVYAGRACSFERLLELPEVACGSGFQQHTVLVSHPKPHEGCQEQARDTGYISQELVA